MARKPKGWTPEEIQRFKDLAHLIHDASQPIEARTQAQRELTQWMNTPPFARLVEGLIKLAEDRTNPTEVLFEANAILLGMTREPYRGHICTVLRGSCDETAACAKCGKSVSGESHGPRDFPGVYCASCCPACGLIPKEYLREVPMTAELAQLLAEHGHADAEPVAREVIRIVREDHWNMSPRTN
jgi:hypothetical protein